MSNLYEVSKAQIDQIIESYKVAYADKKLTLAEVWTLTAEVIEASQLVVAEFVSSPEEKKLVVMQACSSFYDNIIAPIDIPSINNVIEPAVDRLGRTLFLELVSGMYDYIIKFLNKPEQI